MNMSRTRSRGFTLIELMVSVAVVAILASVAMPAYTSYMARSRVPAGLDALSSLATRLEQRFQDTGNYGTSACGVTMPTASYFSITCTLSGGGTGYTATATGSGSLAGYRYTINELGVRATPAHPNGATTTCWTIKGGTCDA